MLQDAFSRCKKLSNKSLHVNESVKLSLKIFLWKKTLGKHPNEEIPAFRKIKKTQFSQ